MKPLLSILAGTFALAAATAHAQLQLKAPGQTAPVYASEDIFSGAEKGTPVEFQFSQELGTPWRFIFTGIEAFADADSVPGSFAWDGQMRLYPQDADGGSDAVVTGGWQFWGSVNGVEVGPITYESSALDHAGTDPQRLWLSEAKVFSEETIEVEWRGLGNTRDPDGYWEILGSVIPEAPAPTGSLTFAFSHYPEKTSPAFQWEVNRPEEVTGSGQNNQGHGNNEDGVDMSNPGQGQGGPTGANNAGDDPSVTDNPDDPSKWDDEVKGGKGKGN